MNNNKPPDFNGIIDQIILWSNVVMGIVVALVVIFAIWKLISITFSIIRNADNSEASANYISSLKIPIIMIIVLLVLIAIMNVVLQIVKSYNVGIGT